MCLPKKDEKFFYYGVQTVGPRTPKAPKNLRKKVKNTSSILKNAINPLDTKGYALNIG